MDKITQTLEPTSLAEMPGLSDAVKETYGLMHTPGEILQQPATWRATFDAVNAQSEDLRAFLRNCGLSGPGNSELCVSLVGAGTSDYVGRALVPLLKQKWRCHVSAVPSTDLLTEMDSVVTALPESTNQLWISFSRSGDSFEGVELLENALRKYPHINHLIVTCSENGKMAAKIARGNPNIYCLLLDKATNDQGLAMTSSFTNMIVAGQCLAHVFDQDGYKPIVAELSEAAERMLPVISELAQKIATMDVTRICFLGSGALKAVADESSLKVLEMSSGHYSVMSESFLGLRHGPLSWLSNDAIVVGFLSNSTEKRQVELGLLREISDKKAAKCILAVVPTERSAAEFIDHRLVLNITDVLDDEHRPPLDVIFGQCLGLFASLELGLKPDAPSADGKIQRVVSQISYA